MMTKWTDNGFFNLTCNSHLRNARHAIAIAIAFSEMVLAQEVIFATQAWGDSPEMTPIAVPESHHQVSRRWVTQDGVPMMLNRYERRDGRNAGLEGEHISTLVTKDGKFKGFIHLSRDMIGKPLPNRQHSERIARDFLTAVAPDLLANMRITSIATYHKPLRINRAGKNESLQVTGMRLKARNTADGSWFWVVIGSDGKPISFERDVGWSNLLFRRSSEYWLHDPWLKMQP